MKFIKTCGNTLKAILEFNTLNAYIRKEISK